MSLMVKALIAVPDLDFSEPGAGDIFFHIAGSGLDNDGAKDIIRWSVIIISVQVLRADGVFLSLQ